MRYARAQDILPQQLLNELQQYIDGAYLYIPRKQENRLAWGERTHSKRETATVRFFWRHRPEKRSPPWRKPISWRKKPFAVSCWRSEKNKANSRSCCKMIHFATAPALLLFLAPKARRQTHAMSNEE